MWVQLICVCFCVCVHFCACLCIFLGKWWELEAFTRIWSIGCVCVCVCVCVYVCVYQTFVYVNVYMCLSDLCVCGCMQCILNDNAIAYSMHTYMYIYLGGGGVQDFIHCPPCKITLQIERTVWVAISWQHPIVTYMYFTCRKFRTPLQYDIDY